MRAILEKNYYYQNGYVLYKSQVLFLEFYFIQEQGQKMFVYLIKGIQFRAVYIKNSNNFLFLTYVFLYYWQRGEQRVISLGPNMSSNYSRCVIRQRRNRASDGARIGPDECATSADVFAWDHGCQFIRADTAEFRKHILSKWLDDKLAVEWRGKFGCLQGNLPMKEGDQAPDFFGLPSHAPVYHGVGGMHAIASGMLRKAQSQRKDVNVQVKVGARVAEIQKITSGEQSGKWLLLGTTGEAALHDSKEEVAAQAQNTACCDVVFDALLITDVSASFEGWHRASAGLPSCASHIRERVGRRVRVPLFTALVAFESKVEVELDGITFSDDTLWFAARSTSKHNLLPHPPPGSLFPLATRLWPSR